jgi:hypothetical protein
VPPTLQVEYGPEAGWHARGVRIVAPITVRARRSGRTAATGLIAFPLLVWMPLADPATTFASFACCHANDSLSLAISFALLASLSRAARKVKDGSSPNSF